MCEVCKSDGWKYKCPHCSVKYCSVDCYKVHCCEKTDTKVPKKHTIVCKENPLKFDSDDETELLEIDKLSQLQCSTIKELLSK